MQILKQDNHPYFELTEVKNEGGERIPHTWASSDENYLKSVLVLCHTVWLF